MSFANLQKLSFQRYSKEPSAGSSDNMHFNGMHAIEEEKDALPSPVEEESKK